MHVFVHVGGTNTVIHILHSFFRSSFFHFIIIYIETVKMNFMLDFERSRNQRQGSELFLYKVIQCYNSELKCALNSALSNSSSLPSLPLHFATFAICFAW